MKRRLARDVHARGSVVRGGDVWRRQRLADVELGRSSVAPQGPEPPG